MPDWKTLSSDIVYETPFFKVHRDKVLNQNGKQIDYSYMELQNSPVIVVAINDEGSILVQQVYRYIHDRQFWEMPAGYMDPGEAPIAAGKRELQEESGYTAAEWHHLGCIYQMVGSTKSWSEIVLARKLTTGEATDKDEDLGNHQFKSIEELEGMLLNQELDNSAMVAALYKVKVFIAKKEK